MDDGHFLSLATISLAVILIFVFSLGGVFIYLFLRGPQAVPVEQESDSVVPATKSGEVKS